MSDRAPDERWYVGTMNDAVFIIDTPPRRNPDAWLNEGDPNTNVIAALGAGTKETCAIAEKIVAEHNAIVAAAPSPPALSGECEEAIAHLKASADGEIIRAECFAAGSADDARGQARAKTFREAAALIERQAREIAELRDDYRHTRARADSSPTFSDLALKDAEIASLTRELAGARAAAEADYDPDNSIPPGCTCRWVGEGNDPDAHRQLDKWCPVHGRDPDAAMEAERDDPFVDYGDHDD